MHDKGLTQHRANVQRLGKDFYFVAFQFYFPKYLRESVKTLADVNLQEYGPQTFYTPKKTGNGKGNCESVNPALRRLRQEDDGFRDLWVSWVSSVVCEDKTAEGKRSRTDKETGTEQDREKRGGRDNPK